MANDFTVKNSTCGAVLRVLFFVWGFFGLLFNSVTYLGLSGSVGVGTSTYIALGMLFWIGGMILFGVGSLVCERRLTRVEATTVSLPPPRTEQPVDYSQQPAIRPRPFS